MFATEGCCDGHNLPRLDLKERCLHHYLHFKYEGCTGVFFFPCMLWGSYSRMSLSAASSCWCFVNYRSRDETWVHECQRMAHSPSLKSPAPAQPGALAASCASPLSFPWCTGRGCHPILKRMLCFPSLHPKEQLPQPDSGKDVWWMWRFILSPCFPPFCSISSAYRPWPEAGGWWEPQVCSSICMILPIPLVQLLLLISPLSHKCCLLQNLSLTYKEIPLAWRCVSQESGISLDRSNISTEVIQFFP